MKERFNEFLVGATRDGVAILKFRQELTNDQAENLLCFLAACMPKERVEAALDGIIELGTGRGCA